MKLTPLDIRQKEFHRGMRGYADADVDEFLDLVADEFERVFKENIDLSDRLSSLQEQLEHYRGIEDALKKTLLGAQQTAEEQRASAQREAQLILRDAEVKARDTLSEAYGAKQTVEREIVLLRNAEADFRFKFRALLEGYLKQLAAAEAGARDKAGEFERQARALREAIAQSGGRAPAEGAAKQTGPPPPAAQAPPATPEATGTTAAPVAADRAAPAQPPAPPATRPRPDEATPAGVAPPQTPPPGPRPSEAPAAGPGSAPQEEGEDTAVIEEPEVRRLSSEEDEDDFFADVDEQVGGKDFKW